MGRRLIDLTGQKFSRLTVIKRYPKNKGSNAQWVCRCECGNVVIAKSQSLRNHDTKSCGCLHDEQAAINLRKQYIKHGMNKTSLYKRWQSIKDRCFNKNATGYSHYGGRGITVCDEWRKSFEAFRDWAFANGYDETAPRGQCTIDRIDTNGNYEPSNCRWVANKKQQNNKRNNRLITYNNEVHTMAEWAEIIGMTPENISKRLKKGWSIEKALTTPAKKYRLKTSK